ncbi:MAG TPA: surface-adhesin E family protein [Phenylobacterium sp.]|uniref:SPOR domain-containing protein n=1 Tax=Phenylobacterium sp. TaxID=1871053 RepID=UPI002B47A150|nr:surface-adhesin E family protein [Phenylobacterium sp.]HKR88265.1 surface-adhesin E family protein [Phenylobacterium sp.]
MTEGRTQARLRAVAITPQAVARGGVLAWETQLDIDCKARQVRAGATTGYATRRGAGDGLTLSPGDAAWRRPKAGSILESSWRAVCDAKFQSPLSGGPMRVAEAKPLSPAPAAQARVAPAPAPVAPRLAPVRLTLPGPTQARRNPKAEPQAAPPPKTSAAPPARPVPVRTAPKAGPNAVQVVSSPIEADTRKKLDRLQRRFGSALQQGVEIRVVQAQVGGQKVYRGVVAGFATRREAHVFCQTLKQSGQDCVAW